MLNNFLLTVCDLDNTCRLKHKKVLTWFWKRGYLFKSPILQVWISWFVIILDCSDIKYVFNWDDAEHGGKTSDTNEIITSMDSEWNVCIFEIRSDKYPWHAVYSDTNRFSLGYMIYPKDFKGSISQTLKRLLRIWFTPTHNLNGGLSQSGGFMGDFQPRYMKI